MTTNSKIGLGVGMVAVFATFAISSWGIQNNKVASINSYNNSAAALSSAKAEQSVVTSSDLKTTAIQQTIPVSQVCTGNMVIANNPFLMPSGGVSNGSYQPIARIKVTNNTNCTAKFLNATFDVISKTGGIPGGEGVEFFQNTTLVDKRQFINGADFNWIMFGPGASSATLIAPNTSVDYWVKTNVVNTATQNYSGAEKDYFSVGLRSMQFMDANNPNTTLLNQTGVPQYFQNNPGIGIWGPIFMVNP